MRFSRAVLVVASLACSAIVEALPMLSTLSRSQLASARPLVPKSRSPMSVIRTARTHKLLVDCKLAAVSSPKQPLSDQCIQAINADLPTPPLDVISDTHEMLEDALNALIASTALIADAIDFPDLFKEASTLQHVIKQYAEIIVDLRGRLDVSTVRRSGGRVDRFKDFLLIVHSTEMLAIKTELDYLKKMMIGEEKERNGEHKSMLIGSQELAAVIDKHLSRLLSE